MKIANDVIRNRIRAHPTFSAVAQPTATRREQSIYIYIYIFPPHTTTRSYELSCFPPGCGDSVADFWVWDAHEARLRCPNDVSGDMQEDERPGGALSLNLLTTTPWPIRESFSARKTSHGRTGNQTRDLMISSQRPWPADHEAGQLFEYQNINFFQASLGAHTEFCQFMRENFFIWCFMFFVCVPRFKRAPSNTR